MDMTMPEGAEKNERSGVHIDATLVTKLNLADFQNAVPMLRELSISNASEVDAKDLELRLDRILGVAGD